MAGKRKIFKKFIRKKHRSFHNKTKKYYPIFRFSSFEIHGKLALLLVTTVRFSFLLVLLETAIYFIVKIKSFHSPEELLMSSSHLLRVHHKWLHDLRTTAWYHHRMLLILKHLATSHRRSSTNTVD